MVLSDTEIIFRAKQGMILPFQETPSPPGKISYGVSSYGYDCRLATQFKIFTNALSAMVDPKNFDPKCFVDVESDQPVIIPPNSFALAQSLEVLDIPRDILVITLGKSTYARCGIVCNVTPLEPEWRGTITIEISNTTPLPALVYPNEGIIQLVFCRAVVECATSYKDKKGKYQGQTGVTLPRM